MAYKRGWQGAGQLSVGNTTKDVTFQADFNQQVGYYTVQFNVALPANLVQLVFPRAELIWSVEGGGLIRRVINLGLGNSISGTGQAVRVRMFDYSIGPPGNPALDYEVSAQVTPGTRPTGARPPILTTRTTGPDPDVRGIAPFYQVLNTATQLIAVPQNSGVNAFLANIAAVAAGASVIPQNGVVGFILNNGFPIDIFNYDGSDRWLPMPPGATHILLDNQSGITIGLGVTWGIEG